MYTGYSTNMQEELLLSSFLPIVVVDERTGEKMLDPLDTGFLEALNGVTKATPYLCKGFEALENLSQQYYSTTSLWWLIGLFNGIQDPYALPTGREILIPDLLEFTTKMNQVKSQVGTVVVL